MVNLVAALMLSQGSIATDPRLSERIRFDASLTPMDHFVGIARVSSGIPLAVDPTLEYLKVDAFVDDQPLGVTLAKLAEVFDLKWQLDGNGYLLVPNKTNLDNTKAYLADEENQIDKVVAHELAVYQEINRLVPKSDKPWTRKVNRFEGWIPLMESAKDELERAKENSETTERIDSLQIKFDALKQISDGKPNLQLARLFGQMTAREIADLRNGVPFFASNEIRARFHYSLGDIKPNESFQVSTAVRSVVVAHVDQDSHRIEYKEMTFLGNNTAMAAEPAAHYPFDEIAPSLRKKPFAVVLKEWDQTDEIAKLLPGAYAPSYDDINGGVTPWYGKRRRLGDHLKWLHKVTNLPIIAQADRVTHPFIRSYRLAKSQGEYISKLVKGCKGFARKSDDLLLVRDGVYWRKATTEIPEQLISKIEHPGKKLTLTDLGTFANNISHLQSMLIEDSNGFVVQFPRFRFAEAYPALKLLSTLDGYQLDLALDNRKGLPFIQLRNDQKELFASGVIDGLLHRGFISDGYLNSLVYKGFEMNMLPAMKFAASNSTISATYSSESIIEEGVPMELIPKRTYPNRSTANLEFCFMDEIMGVKFSTEDLGI